MRQYRETALQRTVVEHLELRGKPGLLYFHCPSGMYAGGKRNRKGVAIQAAIMKALGWRPGISDLLMLYKSKFFALELKSEGGRLTEAQMDFLAAVNAAGGFAAEAVGLDAALRCLEAWQLLRGTTT